MPKKKVKKTEKSIALGKRLQQARKAKGYTQISLANACGLSQGVISKIERGEQESSGYIVLLASELRINASWLDSGMGDMNDVTNVVFDTFMTECYIFTIEKCNHLDVSLRQITTIAESLYNYGKKTGVIMPEIYIPLLKVIESD